MVCSGSSGFIVCILSSKSPPPFQKKRPNYLLCTRPLTPGNFQVRIIVGCGQELILCTSVGIDPLAYGFSGILANEFKDAIIPCVGTNLVPNGPHYGDLLYSACTGVGGARPGATSVTGGEYLASLSYSASNIWRNFGIIW